METRKNYQLVTCLTLMAKESLWLLVTKTIQRLVQVARMTIIPSNPSSWANEILKIKLNQQLLPKAQ